MGDVDLRDSPYFKIRALVSLLRPRFLQVQHIYDICVYMCFYLLLLLSWCLFLEQFFFTNLFLLFAWRFQENNSRVLLLDTILNTHSMCVCVVGVISFLWFFSILWLYLWSEKFRYIEWLQGMRYIVCVYGRCYCSYLLLFIFIEEVLFYWMLMLKSKGATSCTR